MRRCIPAAKALKICLCAVLVLALALGSAGCGAGEAKEEKPVIKIALLSGQSSTDMSDAFAGALEAELNSRSDRDVTYDVTVLLGNASYTKQLSQVEMCCMQDYDILIIEPADPAYAAKLLEAAVRYIDLDEAVREGLITETEAEEVSEEAASEEETETPEEGSESEAAPEEGAGEEETSSEGPGDENAADNVYAAYEKERENTAFNEEGLNAEPRTIVCGVYAPEQVAVRVPVIFTGPVPVIPEASGEAPAEDPGALPPAEWHYVSYDMFATADLFSNLVTSSGILRDVSGDGEIRYAFCCADTQNPVNQAVMNFVKERIAAEYPSAVQAFTVFANLSESAYIERLKGYMVNEHPADVILALDDRTVRYVYDFTWECGYEEDETKRSPMTFDIGDDLLLAGIACGEDAVGLYNDGIAEILVTFDTAGMASSVADACEAVLSGEAYENTVISAVEAQRAPEEEE